MGLGVPVYLLHPLFIHFPIALLVMGFGVGVLAQFPRSPAWFGPATPGILLTGTLFLWIALGLGLLAEHTAPHVPAAWETMADHKARAWLTAVVFSLLCLAQFFLKNRGRKWVLAAWALCLVPLFLTAHLGATLVFTYGLGSPPS